jgi:radical SAM superfamily enzyme YgiQ (UPF0313 family)
MVRAVRRTSDCRIVLGGSGFSIMPEAVLERVGADYGIVGEGERAMVDFVAEAERGRYPGTPCVYPRLPLLPGEEIPSADYDAGMMAYYLEHGSVASVQTKRGCPHRCIYCTYPCLEGGAIRAREPGAVVDDVERLVRDFGAQFLFFIDSVFNDASGRYLGVVEEMKRRGVTVPWTAFFKPGGLSDEHVALMAATGLRAAEIGADAPSDTTLAALGKDFVFRDVVECEAMFSRHGVATGQYYMFGCPEETRETVEEGIRNLSSLEHSAVFVFMGIRILPGTRLLDRARGEGLIPAGWNPLEPIYYVSPRVERPWLEKRLTDAFAGLRHVVFPPDALDETLSFMHKLGYSGSLWDLLLKFGPNRRKRQRGRRSAGC